MSCTSVTEEAVEHGRLVTQLVATPAPRLSFLGLTDIEQATRLQNVLKDPVVRGHYGGRCVFISCDSATSTEVTIACLASALGLEPSEDPMGAIYDHLAIHDRTLIVLENLDEIYSNADPEQQEATEVMLVVLASMVDLALVITLRGTSQPECVTWTSMDDNRDDMHQHEPQAAPASKLPEHVTTTPVVYSGPDSITGDGQHLSASEASHAVDHGAVLDIIPLVAADTGSNTTSLNPEHKSPPTAAGPRTIAQSKVPPPRPAVFHGREKETERLVSYAVVPNTAPIGIVGPGGIGKTTLALKVLHDPRVKKYYGRERFFLTCEGASSADEALGQLAIKLDVRASQNAPLWPAVLDNLRTRQRVLLLIDNFESIWSPTNEELREASEVFLAQLAALDELTLVVTTRGTVLPEDFTWANVDTAELDTLSSTAARLTFNDLSYLEPEVLESESEAKALTELLREIDFVPLAITLLARLDDLPSRLLREWSEHYTAVLEADRHDGSRRELSVEVSIKISLAHLPKESASVGPRQLLSVLGQLPAGLFSGAATELQSTIPSLDLAVQDLLRHSLVYTGGHGELRTLSPVRHYVSAHLPMSRTMQFTVDNIYVNMARAAPPQARYDADGDAYDLEMPNMLSILYSALDRRGDDEFYIGIHSLMLCCFHRHQPCLKMLCKLHLKVGHNDRVNAELQLHFGAHHLISGQFSEAVEAYQRAIDRFAEMGDKLYEGGARIGLASAHRGLGQHEDYDREAARGQLLMQQAAGIVPQINLLGTGGTVNFHFPPAPGGDLTATEKRLRDAREIALQTDDGFSVSNLTSQIVEIVWQRGDTVAFIKELELAIALVEKAQPGSGSLAFLKVDLAKAYCRQGSLDGAETLLIDAYTLATKLNDRPLTATVTRSFGLLRAAQHRLSEAADLTEAAAVLFREWGHPEIAA